jgi:hypothetical protein
MGKKDHEFLLKKQQRDCAASPTDGGSCGGMRHRAKWQTVYTSFCSFGQIKVH